MKKKILVACEYSGIVSAAFRSRGHYVVSCDLIASDSSGYHYTGKVEKLLNNGSQWDMLIGFPPCTFLCRAQGHRLHLPEFDLPRQEAIEFVKYLYEQPIEEIALENPIGFLSTYWRVPDQIIHPWHFGDPHSKDICLWLKNVPPLISTVYHTRRQPVSNHVNSKMTQQQKSKIRSKFFPLVAEAMAIQWG